jgi:hypothetical protein
MVLDQQQMKTNEKQIQTSDGHFDGQKKREMDKILEKSACYNNQKMGCESLFSTRLSLPDVLPIKYRIDVAHYLTV